jgi:hypothetical protein
MTIKEYIESGVLEAYVLGSASEEEAQQLLELKKQYPEIRSALYELETDLERIAQSMSITPPPGTLTKIEQSINDLINIPEIKPQLNDGRNNGYDQEHDSQYISVESESNHIRVHKTWKIVLAVVFILSKIFLIASIYFYLENRQAQQQIQELKTELKQYHPSR